MRKVAVAVVVAVVLAGCGGGGGGAHEQAGELGRIVGTAKIPGLDDQSGILVMAEAVDEEGRPASVQALAARVIAPQQLVTVAQVAAGKAQPAAVPERYTAVTDRSGHFEIRNVPPGKYAVTAMRSGAMAAVVESVEVRPAAATELEISLTPTGKICGAVQIRGRSDYSDILVFIPGTSYVAVTDGDGKFCLDDVPEGTYTVVAEKGSSRDDVQNVGVTGGQTTRLIYGTLLLDPPDNRPPTVTSVHVSREGMAPGESVSMSVRASDPDGDDYTLQWEVAPEAGGTFVGGRTGSRVTWQADSDITAHAHAFWVEARDEYGATSTAPVAVVLVAPEGWDAWTDVREPSPPCSPGGYFCPPPGITVGLIVSRILQRYWCASSVGMAPGRYRFTVCGLYGTTSDGRPSGEAFTQVSPIVVIAADEHSVCNPTYTDLQVRCGIPESAEIVVSKDPNDPGQTPDARVLITVTADAARSQTVRLIYYLAIEPVVQ